MRGSEDADGDNGDGESDSSDSGFFSSIISRLGEIYKKITGLAGEIADAVGGFFAPVVSFLSSIFSVVSGIASAVISGIGEFLTLIFDAITGLAKAIADAFMDLLKTLFIPRDGFFNKKIDSLKLSLAKKFHMETYEELFNALKSYVSGSLTLGGYVDFKLWEKHLPTLKNFIRGFFYPLILLADVRFVLWLIRGTAPIAESSAKD